MNGPLRAAQVRVGSQIQPYAGGYFSRDQWKPVRVEAIGADWVVARDDDGGLWFSGCSPEVLAKYLIQ